MTSTMFTDFLLSFVPLFVAVDPVGVLPMYMAMAHNFEIKKSRRILLLSILTAGFVAILFLFTGQELLIALGISIADFQIAGGIILFILSLIDLIMPHKARRVPLHENFGAVPLGVPIIVGPAVLTTLLLLGEQYGKIIAGLAMLANLFLTWFIFFFSPQFSRILGDAGVKIISKIAMLFLASIGIMMIRRGIQAIMAA